MIPNIEPSLVAQLLKESLNDGKVTTVTVVSDSMAPILRQGDNIVLGAVTSSELEKGEIIVVLIGTDLFAHRFYGNSLQSGQIMLITKGDRLVNYDPFIPERNLVGRVITRQRENHSLMLYKGLGKWLNLKLARLANLEARLLGYPGILALGSPGMQPGPKPLENRPGFVRRLTAFGIYRLAALFSGAVDYLSRFR